MQAATKYMPHTVLIGPTPGLVRLVHLPTGKQWGDQGQERPQLAASVANEQRPMGGEVQQRWPVHAIKNQQTVPTPEGCLVLGCCFGAWMGPLPPLAPCTWHWQQQLPAQQSTERERESEGASTPLFSSQTQTGPARQSILIPTPPPPSPPIPKPHLLHLAPSYRPSVLDLVALVCLLPSVSTRLLDNKVVQPSKCVRL